MKVGRGNISLRKSIGICFFLVYSLPVLLAQPKPGDLFREYLWLPSMVKEKEKFLRVGGRLDYQIAPQHMSPEDHENGFLSLSGPLDLKEARRVEVVFEMVQSHDDTKGLAIQINSNDWLSVPPLENIPQPQSRYMLHSFPALDIPIDYFHDGSANQFRLRVDTVQRWNWPQHIFYAVIFRVYYHEQKLSIDEVRIEITENGGRDGSVFTLSISNLMTKVKQVDYLGKYLDYNFEGDGLYYQWHGHPHRGHLRNHIGGSNQSPFQVDWNTSWLPDQTEPLTLMARITYESGLMVMSEAFDGPHIDRTYSVELCRPYHQPINWATRQDTFQSKFSVHGKIDNAVAYQLAWRSWSPCYGEGVFINGHKIWEKGDPCYGYAEHLVEIAHPQHLIFGENTIETGMTPLHDGKMVHGMEVQYPGIMVKVKYESKQAREEVSIKEGFYEGRPHFIVLTPHLIYYYDQAGGGLSRLIDRDGIDWIDFKTQPWGDYPAAAASAFRGIPNFVHGSPDGGAGHPGHNSCTSKVINENEIITESKSGKWRWKWRFFDDHASVEMLNVDPGHAYWFLYEGVPGGKFDPDHQYFGTNASEMPTEKKWDFHKGDKLVSNFNWAYFGHDKVNRIIYLKQLDADNASDTFSYLGNSEMGAESNDGMVVFGFGRADGAKPLLTDLNTFYLGVMEQAIRNRSDHNLIRKHLEGLR